MAASRWRWGVVLVAVAGLLVLPPALQALPVPDQPDIGAEDLLARVAASADVAHNGTAESRGELDLPDVRRLGDLVALLGGTTRTRVWYAGPEEWRVDEQRPAADVSTYRDAAGTWTWDSEEGTVVRVLGDPAVRLPRPADLGPAELGRRLAAAGAGGAVTRTPGRTVAGRTGLGLRVIPADTRSLVERIDLWVDSETGLPLRVEVTAQGETEATAESQWLDLAVGAPPEEVTDFDLPPFVAPTTSDAPDVAALVNRLAPFALPARLADLPRRESASGVGGSGGAGTYGEHLTTFAVLPLPRDIGRETFRSLDGASLVREVDLRGQQALALETPLLSALVVRGAGRAYLLAGPVVPAVLEQAALELVLDPPTLRPDAPR